jgi:transposase
MDRDQLKAWLNAGLSLPEIGALTNRDPSTVGYWVQKHGLVANGRDRYAPRGGLTREQLEPLVESGATLHEIATTVDRSPGTVRYWIARHGLESPKAVRRRQRDRARASGERTFIGDCRTHGETVFVVENSGRGRCRKCRMERVTERRRKVKRLLIEERGGRCLVCSYDRFVGALHFHHVDPAAKEFAVSKNGATLGIATLRAEAEKCVVLCANCHAEVEAGVATLPAT